jgi:uncharacterized protein DUF6891
MAKLDDAFAELESEGYFAKQNYQCCRTCGWAAARIALKAGGFSDLNAIYVRTASLKIVFYHEQDAGDLERTGKCCLRWEGDGNQICGIMNKHGIATRWDGSPDMSIEIFVGAPAQPTAA